MVTRSPGRGYSWPQAEPGNSLAFKYGGTSERTRQLVADVAERLREELAAHPRSLAPSATLLHQLAQADALAELFAVALIDALGSGDERGREWRSREFRAYVRLGLELRREAGLTARVRLERLRVLAGSLPSDSGLEEFVARAQEEADRAGTA